MFETLLLKANALSGLNPALLGGFPQVSNPPIDDRPLIFLAVKTTTCHFPTVNLVSYTKKKHQTASPNAQ